MFAGEANFPLVIQQKMRQKHETGCSVSVRCGSSSGVEHNLAKVGVEGSNPFSRSSFSLYSKEIR
jgi:hypothetical protein